MLIPGNYYFYVNFYDNELTLPNIGTLVDFGREDTTDHGRLWLFKEPESPPSPDEEAEDQASSEPVVDFVQ